MNANSQGKTRRLAGLALFTALIVILQLLGSFIRFGPVSVSLVALPIVVGAAVYGSVAGLWLGFVFGVVVLLSGDAAAFFAFWVSSFRTKTGTQKQEKTICLSSGKMVYDKTIGKQFFR